MSDSFDMRKLLEEDIDFDDLVDFSTGDEIVSSVIRDASSGGNATQAGIQTNSLQSAMDNYARSMDRSAIAKSTGLPVKTASQQYKGFIAEEYFKNTLKINALAKGHPDWKIGVYTKGQMPDGTNLSGIDMEIDISIWTREHPWSKPMKTKNYQSKIHNDASAYAKDINNPQYKNVDFVGGANQGVNDRLQIDLNGKPVCSDSNTPDGFLDLADAAKAQKTPEYSKKQEKFDELNKINLERAIAAGAATGLILSTVQEIVDVIGNSKELSKEQFIRSIEHIMCSTIEGGVRGGAMAGSVQLFGKMLGREVAANSFEAIPVMVTANVAVDLAKDLYNCFVTQTIDRDDLLCNTVNNVFCSASDFGGGWVGGQIGGQITGQTVVQSMSLFTSAKTSAAAGASIGSSLGPIGTIVGSVVGGIMIGMGAKAIIKSACEDTQKAYDRCIAEINSHLDLSNCERLYYFAESMESLSEVRLSFKGLLPCQNLLSDLFEYNAHKKAMQAKGEQLIVDGSKIDDKMKKILMRIEREHQERIAVLLDRFAEQRMTMQDDFKEAVNTYVANSYMEYISLYDVLEGDINMLIQELKDRKTEHTYILDYMRNRNEVNEQINITLHELLEDDHVDLLMPFIDKIMWFIQQDELMVGRQYISYDEALYLVDGGDHR